MSVSEVNEFGYPQVVHDSTTAGDQPWIKARQELVSEVARVFEGVAHRLGVGSSFGALLCGKRTHDPLRLDCLKRGVFPLRERRRNLYAAGAWSFAQNAVESVGLLRFPSTPADVSFSSLFPKLTARPLQAALDSYSPSS